MMKPDGTWLCPMCTLDNAAVTCWHPILTGARDNPLGGAGCSTWYGGRLLHFTKEEVERLKYMRKPWTYCSDDTADVRHLAGLGFLGRQVPEVCFGLTAEGENLCRHLWGMEGS